MKKQIVLSLSVLMLAIGSDLFAPTGGGVVRGGTRVEDENQTPVKKTPDALKAVVPASAEAAAQKCTLADVAAVATELAGDQQSTESGKRVAKAYITGSPVSGSAGNKSNKLGRLGK